MDDPQHLRPVRPGQPVVLVAEDETMICNIARIALEAMGLFVLAANDGEQALALSRQFPGTIHALVCDIVMPNLDGLGLCEQILNERPSIKVLLMSGVAGSVDGLPFLEKPFKPQELQGMVRQLMAGD